MKLLHVSRDALALGLGAALVADRFVPDLGLTGGRHPDDSFYRPLASTRFSLQQRLCQVDGVGYLTTNRLIRLAAIIVVYLQAQCRLTTCRAALLAPSGATPPTVGGLQLDRVPLPSPMSQQQRDAS